MVDMESLNQVKHLTAKQREKIIDLSRHLQMIADIAQADVFIDCLLSEKKAIVVAEAKPTTTQSLYHRSVLGEIAFEASEPGVMFSLQSGKSIVGSRGISQENVVMQQDIVPIIDVDGKTIAVLIKESDISKDIDNEKKLKLLMKSSKEETEHLLNRLTIQEIHHRVKNNLQIIASLLRLRIRRASSKEVADVFSDSTARISSMAMIHDYLAQSGREDTDIKFVMERIATLLLSSSGSPDKEIGLLVKGETLFLPAEKATSLALVVIELILNSVKHAFYEISKGTIVIDVQFRKQMVYVTVSDDGCGLNLQSPKKKSSLGLQIVDMLVEEQLQGAISFFSSNRGTVATIAFPFIDKELQ